MGDIHFSQGDGEITFCGAIEMAGWIELHVDVIKGGIPISGLFDLRPFRHSWLQPKLQLDADLIERQSPLFHIPEHAPPLLVTLGGDESSEFHRQSADYVAAWRARGHRAEEFAQPGKNHLTAIGGFEQADSALCRALMDFIAAA